MDMKLRILKAKLSLSKYFNEMLGIQADEGDSPEDNQNNGRKRPDAYECLKTKNAGRNPPSCRQIKSLEPASR